MVSSRLALASSKGQPGLSKFSRQVWQVTSHYQESLRTTGNEAELAPKFEANVCRRRKCNLKKKKKKKKPPLLIAQDTQ